MKIIQHALIILALLATANGKELKKKKKKKAAHPRTVRGGLAKKLEQKDRARHRYIGEALKKKQMSSGEKNFIPRSAEMDLSPGPCIVDNPDWVGDGYCDEWGGYNTAECGYDGGDCCEETCVNGDWDCGFPYYSCRDPDVLYPNCDADNEFWVGDGWCDPDAPYNTADCGWDGGDCCPESCRDSTYDCGMNADYDCRDPHVLFPYCYVETIDYVGDGYCDWGFYNTAECGYDGGDCCEETCRDSIYECGFVGYDCRDPSTLYPLCNVDNLSWVGDGMCDTFGDYNTDECGFDGGDCCPGTCRDSTYECGEYGYDCVDPSQ